MAPRPNANILRLSRTISARSTPPPSGKRQRQQQLRHLLAKDQQSLTHCTDVFRTGNLSPPHPKPDGPAEMRARLQSARTTLEVHKTPPHLRVPPKPAAFETQREMVDHVEARIQESMRKGAFDNLKNKGRPLRKQPSTALDYMLRNMKENGIRPQWLQLMHDIDLEKRLFRSALSHAWHEFMPHAPRRWNAVLRVAECRIAEINRAVDTFNLTRPFCVQHLFRMRLRIAEEIERARESLPPGKQEKTDGQRLADKRDDGGERVAEEPRPAWQLYARFLRATEVREYENTAWGRRRQEDDD